MTIFLHKFGCLVNLAQTGFQSLWGAQLEDCGTGKCAKAVSHPLNLEASERSHPHKNGRAFRFSGNAVAPPRAYSIRLKADF